MSTGKWSWCLVPDLAARVDDCFGGLAVEQSQLAVGFGGSLLHRRGRCDEGGEFAQLHATDREILYRAQCLHSVKRRAWHFALAEQVPLASRSRMMLGRVGSACRVQVVCAAELIAHRSREATLADYVMRSRTTPPPTHENDNLPSRIPRCRRSSRCRHDTLQTTLGVDVRLHDGAAACTISRICGPTGGNRLIEWASWRRQSVRDDYA